MTWSVNNLFGFEIGKNLQKYSPTHGKPGADLFFFGDHHVHKQYFSMVVSKKKKVNTLFCHNKVPMKVGHVMKKVKNHCATRTFTTLYS